MPSCHRCGGRMQYTGNGSNKRMTAELKCRACGYRHVKQL